MTNRTILVVDDETAIRDMLRIALEMADYQVIEAGDTKRAHELIVDQQPDLILLDWMLPGSTGIEFARRLKKDDISAEIPIIMLTAKGEEDNKIQGLNVGADDYITKPFSPKELIARLQAVLRRASPSLTDDAFTIADLRLDPASHKVTIGETPVQLGPTEFRLLKFFLTHKERVYSRSQLLDQVWGGNVYVEERTVDVHIRRLRKALSIDNHERHIQTVRGAGYRFSSKVDIKT